MTINEFIELAKKLDPSGESHISGGGVLWHVDLSPSYYDGTLMIKTDDGVKYVKSGTKLNMEFRSIEDVIEINPLVDFDLSELSGDYLKSVEKKIDSARALNEVFGWEVAKDHVEKMSPDIQEANPHDYVSEIAYKRALDFIETMERLVPNKSPNTVHAWKGGILISRTINGYESTLIFENDGHIDVTTFANKSFDGKSLLESLDISPEQEIPYHFLMWVLLDWDITKEITHPSENYHTKAMLALKVALESGKRYEEGEPLIAKSAAASYHYACDVLKDRFLAGEEAVSRDWHYSYWYIRRVLKERNEKMEKWIANSPQYAYEYALNVLKGPFPLAEMTISVNPMSSLVYAKNVLKGRFPAGEDVMKTIPTVWDQYQEFLNENDSN